MNTPPTSNGSNSRDLTGVGIGLSWKHPNNNILQFIYAARIRSHTFPEQTSPDNRAWILLSKNF
jgi:hypothetical protein